MAVSIKDIAERLNVSTATVSLTLSGQGDLRKVSKKTQQRVLACARELRYQPNVLARSLNKGYSENLGLIVPDITDSFFSQLADQIELEAEKRNYTLMMCCSHNDYRREERMIGLLQQKRVDGLLIAPLRRPDDGPYQNLADGFPAVAFDQLQPQWKGNSVVSNDRKTSGEIVERMVRRGARRIALLCIDAERYSIRERVRGYREALEAAGIAACEELYAELSIDSYRCDLPQVLDRILAVRPRVDAFFFTTHLLAEELVHYMQERGVRLPDDCQLACFHGNMLLRSLFPSITIVQMPIEEIARESVRLICDQIEYRKKGIPAPPAEHLILDCIFE
ncbi:MAG: LacI family transcriptional regulator [Bacteroidaceae bacterium]|nr:LacI family transcriptional regulator [Bacteroidaceae bacterium]